MNLFSRPIAGKVLIVEPDPDIARMLEVRLARDGHEVITADTAKRAIDTSKNLVLDVAIVDLAIVDGPLELVEKLRAAHRPFEVLVTSVDPSPEIVVKALELGAMDVIVKPFQNLKIVTIKARNAVAKVRAERDRDELARMLAAQTQDIVHREEAAERAHPALDEDEGLDLEAMSSVDSLTGMPSRAAADERFKKEAARALRYDRPLCVALASIDDLDAVIDRFGGSVADGVLRGVAAIFSGMVRDVDFCARRHGGEFVFIFPETSKDSGFIVVDRIRQALSQTSFSEFVGDDGTGGGFRVSASFGIAAIPTDTLNVDLLRESAETALAHAKTARDKVVLFDATMMRRV